MLHAKGHGEFLMDIIGKIFAADTFYQNFCQRKTVVAVNRIGTRVRFQGLPGQLIKKRIMSVRVVIIKQKSIGEAGPLESGGMVKQHAWRD
ncbi:hypothetical protein D3C74_259990 [compost metagenome]